MAVRTSERWDDQETCVIADLEEMCDKYELAEKDET